MLGFFLSGLFYSGLAVSVAPLQQIIQFQTGPAITRDSIHNVGIRPDKGLRGRLHIIYGDCDLTTFEQVEQHVATVHLSSPPHPDRLVWTVSETVKSGGCLCAFHKSCVVGRSQPIQIHKSQNTQKSLADVADIEGQWFNGVARMTSKNVSSVSVSEAKSKRIAIVGAGISGLFTSMLLTSVGMTNWHIYEASSRIGGRIRTEYMNGSRPEDYQYQEMGPMRFPWSITYDGTNESLPIKDNRLVQQLAEKLNELNGYRHDLLVRFIPWIQASPNTPIRSNGVRMPDGTVPRRSDVARNQSLAGSVAPPPNTTAADEAQKQFAKTLGISKDMFNLLARNVYQAHKLATTNGALQWSEESYLRYGIHTDPNLTDYLAQGKSIPVWSSISYENFPYGVANWMTIDKGLDSLPRAFMPWVKDRLSLNFTVTGMEFIESTEQVNLRWRGSGTGSALHDYAIVTAPFSKVRLWHPIPEFSSLLSRAIEQVEYTQACKVVLMYRTRFWEHLEKPIFGGCGAVDIPGIGPICYPSYQLNSSGPGVLLASYTNGSVCRAVAALPEADHIDMVRRAMVEVHGPIAEEQYTGIYARQIWDADPFTAGGWSVPRVGQQDLYLQSYFHTEFNTIFVGEHTSTVNAWIWSAMESAARGTVQLLLDLGLIDEAKQIVNEWMARWIHI